MRREASMRYGVALCALLALGLVGCGTDDTVGAPAPVPAPEVPEVTADDLRRALGMQTFLVDVPKDGSYGVTLKHAGGFVPGGYSNFKAGQRVRALYWVEGDRLKYSLQSGDRGNTGELSIANAAPFLMRGVPDKHTLYRPGDIVAKWTVGMRMGSGGPDGLLEEGEAGVVFVLQSDATPLAKLNMQAAAAKPEAPPSF